MTRGYTEPGSDIEGENSLEERVISVDRVSRTVKGGRRIRFRALVVVGDRAGRVNLAVAKAGDVQNAVSKARKQAEKSLITLPLIKGTIPHPIEESYGPTKVVLKPAKEGHSIIAGGAVRAVLELAGIKNIVSKTLNSGSALNSALATVKALKKLTKQDEPIY